MSGSIYNSRWKGERGTHAKHDILIEEECRGGKRNRRKKGYGRKRCLDCRFAKQVGQADACEQRKTSFIKCNWLRVGASESKISTRARKRKEWK